MSEDMTRDAGASRTFRTIFGCDVGENAAALELTLKRNEHEDDEDEDWSDDGHTGDAVEHEDNNNGGECRIPGSPQLLADVRPSDAAHRSRSIEEWADDDDDEDSWKDVLQARVNQLELVLPLGSQAALHHAVDHASAAPPGLPTLLLPGQHALITDHTKPQDKHLQVRKRSTSTDFVARNIKAATELKRSTSGPADPRKDGSTPRASSSAGTRSRRGSMDGSNPAGSSVFSSVVSDAEMVRRFVVNDVKNMSMERLVNDAKRLHALEDFYRVHHDASNDAASSSAGQCS